MKLFLLLLLSFHLSAIPLKVPTHFYQTWENTRSIPGLGPFIGHLAFRNICDHIIDRSTEWFDPDTVEQGDTIYLNLWYIDWFVEKVHDQINCPYILVSGDVGGWLPEQHLAKVLYDPKLAAWFCRNMVFSYHPKLFQLPMGQDLHLFIQTAEIVNPLIDAHEKKSQFSKEHLLYMNFYSRPHGDRDKIAKIFENQPYCFSDQKHNALLPKDIYYQHLASSKFALSPLGLETDSVRTWEAFVFDCIPIVEHTFNDPIYEGMPILIVDNWKKIDQALLEKKYEELKDLSREKAYFSYWEQLIKNTQLKVKNNDLAFTQLEATRFSQKEIETIGNLLANRGTFLLYKGFLSTLRPFQLSEQMGCHIDLYDPWLNWEIFEEIRPENNPGRVFFLPLEEIFNAKASSAKPVSLFLDLTYYRTSLKIDFYGSTCYWGNFRHSLKSDLEDLFDKLAFGSLIVGNMGDEPYVKKVLDSFAEENGITVLRSGSIWSLLKEKVTISLEVLFPTPYPSGKDGAQPFHLSKWASHSSMLRHLMQRDEEKHVILIGPTLTAEAIFLSNLTRNDSKVFVIDAFEEESDFQQFLSNIVHARLTDKIIPVRMDPAEAIRKFRRLDLPIHLIYIDSSLGHAQAIKILQTWISYLEKGVNICGSDWNIPEFRSALSEFAKKTNQILHAEGDFWMFNF